MWALAVLDLLLEPPLLRAAGYNASGAAAAAAAPAAGGAHVCGVADVGEESTGGVAGVAGGRHELVAWALEAIEYHLPRATAANRGGVEGRRVGVDINYNNNNNNKAPKQDKLFLRQAEQFLVWLLLERGVGGREGGRGAGSGEGGEEERVLGMLRRVQQRLQLFDYSPTGGRGEKGVGGEGEGDGHGGQRSRSLLQESVGETLRSMGLGRVEEEVRHELDAFRIASGYEVDFSIPSLRTLIEVDGEPALLFSLHFILSLSYTHTHTYSSLHFYNLYSVSLTHTNTPTLLYTSPLYTFSHKHTTYTHTNTPNLH